MISSKHAIIDKGRICDLSTNGTFINVKFLKGYIMLDGF